MQMQCKNSSVHTNFGVGPYKCTRGMGIGVCPLFLGVRISAFIIIYRYLATFGC